MPLPDKKAEFLNTGALRKLLPGGDAAPLSGPSAEDPNAVIQRLMRSSGGRFGELEKRTQDEARRAELAARRAKKAALAERLASQFAATDGGSGRPPSRPGTSPKRPRSEMGARGGGDSVGGGSSIGSRGGPRGGGRGAFGVTEIGSRALLADIGMTFREFVAIDTAYHKVSAAAAPTHA